MTPPRPIRLLAPEDLRSGLIAEFERDITEADVLDFAEKSGDHNPLHVDSTYATTTTFGRRIVHGAFQVGLASALIGMDLPGRNSLLGGIQARFPSPLYFPTRVRVRGVITSWNLAALSGRLRVVITDLSRNLPTAEIDASFTLHTTSNSQPRSATVRQPVHGDMEAMPTVLITGASGGLGQHLVGKLVGSYRVLAQINRTPLPVEFRGHPHVVEVVMDFEAPDWTTQLEKILGTTPLYGIIHAAWPGLPHGSLLDMDVETIESQLRFGSTHLVKLGAILRERVGPKGGRLIAIGSTAATKDPQLPLGAFSLGKTLLEHSIRLLAPELARKAITANVVSPSYMPLGQNKVIGDERRLKMEAARVPLGRLCSEEDVAAAVTYLLSSPASFLSGEVVHLTGGKI